MLNHKISVRLLHWRMLDCLMDEVYCRRWPYEPDPENIRMLLVPDMLVDQLFKEYARKDPRFQARGLGWDAKHYSVTYQVGDRRYLGPAACARFLEEPDAPSAHRPSASIHKILYEDYGDLLNARVKLHNRLRRLERLEGIDIPGDIWEHEARFLPQMDYLNPETHLPELLPEWADFSRRKTAEKE